MCGHCLLATPHETMFADMLTKAAESSQNNSRRTSEAFAWPPVHRKKLVSENRKGSVM